MNRALPVFLMSPPRLDWTLRGKANFRSENANPVDAVRARAEWARLANAIVAAGGEVIVCPPNPRKNLTGLIYTAEAGEFYRESDGAPRYILPNMSVEHRRAEADWIGGFVEGIGFGTVAIRSTWEAQGDVLRAARGTKIVHTFGSGRYRRTEGRAYEEVAHRIGHRHIQIHFRADPWFHGNTFLNFYQGLTLPARLGEDGPRVPTRALVCEDALMPGELDRLRRFLPEADFVSISREQSMGYDTNCLQVNRTVIGSDSMSSQAEAAFVDLGLTVVKLDLSELFMKGGGAPVCLTNRLWGIDLNEISNHARWSLRPEIEAHTSH